MADFVWLIDKGVRVEFNSQVITLRDSSGNTITINDVGKLLSILQEIYKLKYSDW